MLSSFGRNFLATLDTPKPTVLARPLKTQGLASPPTAAAPPIANPATPALANKPYTSFSFLLNALYLEDILSETPFALLIPVPNLFLKKSEANIF